MSWVAGNIAKCRWQFLSELTRFYEPNVRQTVSSTCPMFKAESNVFFSIAFMFNLWHDFSAMKSPINNKIYVALP